MKEQREDNWSKLRQLDADWTEQDTDEQHVGEPISFFLWKFSSELLFGEESRPSNPTFLT